MFCIVIKLSRSVGEIEAEAEEEAREAETTPRILDAIG